MLDLCRNNFTSVKLDSFATLLYGIKIFHLSMFCVEKV